MKTIKNILLIFAGFISGILFVFRLIIKSKEMLKGFKKGLIDDFEYLVLGYNTIKTEPYRPRVYPYSGYYRPYGRGAYTTQSQYRDYYDNSFEDDEEREGD